MSGEGAGAEGVPVWVGGDNQVNKIEQIRSGYMGTPPSVDKQKEKMETLLSTASLAGGNYIIRNDPNKYSDYSLYFPVS